MQPLSLIKRQKIHLQATSVPHLVHVYFLNMISLIGILFYLFISVVLIRNDKKLINIFLNLTKDDPFNKVRNMAVQRLHNSL